MSQMHKYIAISWLVLGVACAPETTPANASPSAPSLTAQPMAAPPASIQAAVGGASAVPPPAPAPAITPTPRSTAAGASAASSTPAAPLPAAPSPAAAGAAAEHHAAAGAPAVVKPPAMGATAGASKADAFCDKYEKNCGFAKPQRHADRAACVADFNATPAQQACKNMHLDTAIAGTAAACNGMPSEFCFAIHCLHAAGIPDQTGTTYCK